MIILDYKDTRPIYEQVADKLRKLIINGVLEPDSRMPSVRTLAVELSVNPNTIQKAYAWLEREGFLYTIKGRGNFVTYNEDLHLQMQKEYGEKLLQLIREAGEAGIGREELFAYVLERGEENDSDLSGQ